MIDNKTIILIQIIEEYESISRDALAYNLRKAMGYPQVKITEQDNWLAKLFGITREAAYSWFGPGHNAKAPLKVVARISFEKGIPIMELLKPPKEEITNMRIVSKRSDSYEKDVIDLYKKYPKMTTQEMSVKLGITYETVLRHLKKYKAKNEID